MGKRPRSTRLPVILLQRSPKNCPLHRQLYEALRDLIVAGELPEGTRLPSTRVLADALGLSRNTVVNAYEELGARNYLEAKTGSGSRVCSGTPRKCLRSSLVPARAFVTPSRTQPSLNLRWILRQAHYPVRRVTFADQDGSALYLYTSDEVSRSSHMEQGRA